MSSSIADTLLLKMSLKQGPDRSGVQIDLAFDGEPFLSWTIRYSSFGGFSLAIEFGKTGDKAMVKFTNICSLHVNKNSHIYNEIYISDLSQNMLFKMYMRLSAVGKFRVASRDNNIGFSMQI